MIAYQVTNHETTMTAIVWAGIPGMFSVMLRDDDSGETLPTIGIANNLPTAIDQANKWADVKTQPLTVGFGDNQTPF